MVGLRIQSSSLTELARWLDRDLSSLSSAIRRLEGREKEEPAIGQDMERVRALMSNEGFATSQA